MKNNTLRLIAIMCLIWTLMPYTGLSQLKVQTNPFIARGSTEVLARCTVTGVTAAKVQEFGICWSTTNNPTISDNKTSEHFTQAGFIYHIKGLKPATVYYMRGYALLKDGTIGYGDVVKVITIPAGQISWSYNNGGSPEENARINAAVADAVDYLNTFTSIKGFHTSVNYGSGTPTADCSYGGWMRVGPDPSYQKTGTILHELLHGIGVGQHWIWKNNANLRANTSRGAWLGDRATQIVRFLDNKSTATLNGDDTHMWPYGINGAHEDSGSELLYIGCALIAQALGEDGLPPTGGFCTPAYSLPQEDTIKYYIKNEDPNGGLYNSYLVENKIGNLVWKELSAKDVETNDSCAWYVTFKPDNCYYQIKNVATGHYITYKKTGINGISTIEKEKPGSAENFHLMRSRIDTPIGNEKNTVNLRGYWIIHPENIETPQCLTVSSAGMTTTSAYNMSNQSTKQRWIFLQAHEIETLEAAAHSAALSEFTEVIDQMKSLVATSHIEISEGADATIQAFIASLEAQNNSSTSLREITALINDANEATTNFLNCVKVENANNPFDLTYMIQNPGMDNTDGWSIAPTLSVSCGEFYQMTFDMYQSLKNMPEGTYLWCVQGFQRPGSSANSYSDYIAGKNNVAASLYGGNKSVKIQHIATEAQKKRIHSTDAAVGGTNYIPNTMEGSSHYFTEGMYENKLFIEHANTGNLRLGIRNTSAAEGYWTIFDNFRLYYYGKMSESDINTIQLPCLPQNNEKLFATPTDIYNIVGVRVRTQASSLEGLPRGIYIIKGHKVIVK